MIPAALTARLSACSPAELAVLWRAFSDLLEGIERGRAQYGSEPGADGRDYVAEAMAEIRDACLYLAMDRVRRERFTIADGSPCNVTCPACGALPGRWCGTVGNAVAYCQERIAANRRRLGGLTSPDWPSAVEFEGEAP